MKYSTSASRYVTRLTGHPDSLAEGRGLYSLPVAAVISDRELGGLNDIIYSLPILEARSLMPGCQQGHTSAAGSRGASPSSWRLPAPPTC